ncbi:MAG: Gfo/Idh/MocA family oxidoreductase [Proteobacteria bacterium]|nr:MAG: Gfo/Idh/MocA family oxidoreductase [Pseudomonadota bacterium]
MTKIRTCLFGLGHMGKNHLRVLQEDSRYELVAVIDPVTDSLPATAQAVPLYKHLPDDLAFELAVVAAPTELHYSLVTGLLQRNHHVFVEKPAASTQSQAEELVALAQSKNLKLAVGNIERCNPVVGALRKVIGSGILGRLVHLNGLRAGGFPRNVKPGNNVILDLGVHELDLFRMILGPLDIVHGIGHSTQMSSIYDAAEISVRSKQGVTGTVHVNWLTPQRMRSIRVTGSEGLCLVDYIQQTCEVFGNGLKSKDSIFASLPWQTDAQGLDTVQIPVVAKESLKEQLDQLHLYLSGKDHVLAIGAELIESVSLVEQAEKQVASAHVLPFHDPQSERR